MLREQVINFLEAAVVLLVLTNAVSALAAAYAISLARSQRRPNLQVSGQPVLLKLPTWRVRQ